ncbi:MAG: helix-turn-helix domain-containing protein [Clostridiales bacterium]|nr:helix-turn-helix domain-containing protein [Clostridiales bacterium]
MEALASRLVEARKNCGLTQAQVAEKLFLTTQSVSSWECGNSIPDTEKIPEIAALYGVTTDWLLSGRLPSAEILEVTSNLSDRLFSEARMATYVSAYCNAKKLYETKRALAFAKEKHNGQYRKPGHGDERIPYIYHPLLLVCHALALGLEEDDLLSACLLHDVCEDCGVSPEELPVSEEAREAVRLLTKPEHFSKTEKEYHAYYDGIGGNRIASIVKLLDRCNNVSSMATSFSDERMAEYIKETQEYIHPLMEKARDEYPQYSNALFLIRYHMNSVLEAMRHHMRSSL